MKNYIELLLGALIIALSINVPDFLQEMSDNSLGKMLLLSIVVFLLCSFGKNAGILAAIVYIIIVYKTGRESFKLFEGVEFKISMGADKKKDEEEEMKNKEKLTNSPTDDASCKETNSKKPYWNNQSNACQADEPFSSKQIEKLKNIANKEGFSNFKRHLHLQEAGSLLSHQNTTDNDRDVKVKAEKAKIAASKEKKDEDNQTN